MTPSINDAMQLSRRERQIMDLLFASGRATAAEVMEGLPDAPCYSAVRALLRILETEGPRAARRGRPSLRLHARRRAAPTPGSRRSPIY